MSNLNEALRLIRVFNDMSLSELSTKLNTSAGYLSEIESQKKKPSLEIIKRYAEFFNIKQSAIMFFSENIKEDGKTKKKVRSNIVSFLKIIENIKIEDEKTKTN